MSKLIWFTDHGSDFTDHAGTFTDHSVLVLILNLLSGANQELKTAAETIEKSEVKKVKRSLIIMTFDGS